MTQKKAFPVLLFIALITSCSANLNPELTLQKVPQSVENKDNLNNISGKYIIFPAEKDFADLEKEYSVFTIKSLTQAYFDRKINYWLSIPDNLKLLKELRYAMFKHPGLAEAYFTAYNDKQSEIVLKPEIYTQMQIEPAFATFMNLIHSGFINTIAGNGLRTFGGDGGSATSASLSLPRGLTFDSLGNLYIADEENNRIRRIDKLTKVITTVAGGGADGETDPPGPATSASLNHPFGIAFDASDNMYFTDTYNNVVRRVDKITGKITRYAGGGPDCISTDPCGDNGPASNADLKLPQGLTFDTEDNLYITDQRNYKIRKVDKISGNISTIAGIGLQPYIGLDPPIGDNGLALSATLNDPAYLAFDSSGNIFFSDTSNHRIRKITVSTGIITTIAGNGIGAYGGDNGPATSAELYYPSQLNFDFNGNIYVADYYNSRIRKINTEGTITTIAGTGNVAYSGDGGPATAADFQSPFGLTLDNQGNIYVSDSYNFRIRKIYK